MGEARRRASAITLNFYRRTLNESEKLNYHPQIDCAKGWLEVAPEEVKDHNLIPSLEKLELRGGCPLFLCSRSDGRVQVFVRLTPSEAELEIREMHSLRDWEYRKALVRAMRLVREAAAHSGKAEILSELRREAETVLRKFGSKRLSVVHPKVHGR